MQTVKKIGLPFKEQPYEIVFKSWRTIIQLQIYKLFVFIDAFWKVVFKSTY